MIQQPRRPDDSREPLRLMVVVAHPHDFTHCAGTCGIHASRGDAVSQTCSMIFPFHPEPCRKPEDGAWTRSDRFRVNCPGLPNPDMMPGGGL